MADNGSHAAKTILRQRVLAATPGARVLEGFTGEGRMYRSVWCDAAAGATIDILQAKARDAARERPAWAVYRGDTEKALRAGWAGHVPWEIVDLDAYGSPWPFVMAWFESRRLRAPTTTLILTDGYMRQASMANPCRALFQGQRPARVKDRDLHTETHQLVKAALADGTIDASEPCEACGLAQGENAAGEPLVVRHHWDYAQPLDTIPLCHSCHRRVHVGKVPEPRTGRVYVSYVARIDCPPEMYLETARSRLNEWAAAAGGSIASFDTIADANMRLHTVVARFAP